MLALLLLSPHHPAPASAAVIQPWSPPGDSLTRLAHSARLRFQRQAGDSVGGDNYDGYEIVGDMGRHLVAALGKDHWEQATALQATLDSMGLDVEVRVDPQMRDMVFMLVRNPFKRSSDGVGYLYWLRGDQWRMQGASYPPAQDVSVRFWYRGDPEIPYEAVTIYRMRQGNRVAMRLYRLNGEGVLWDLVQYEGNAPDLGSSTTTAFADINHDGLPEIVAYEVVQPDTFLSIASDAPQLVQEYIYTERPEGFVLHDLRQVPGPSDVVNLFATLLVRHEDDLARRLLMRPAQLDSALALGWGQSHARGAFTIEYGESRPWPEWLELKIRQYKGYGHWLFRFWIKDGRWVIKEWIQEQPPSPNNVRPPDQVRYAKPAAQPAPAGKDKRP